jgi:alpha-tubulin suppressor-like RCC1 family protein
MLHSLKSPSRAVVLAALCLLAACGGGGGGGSSGSNSADGNGNDDNSGSPTNPGQADPGVTGDNPPSSFGDDYSDRQATVSAMSAGRAAWNVTTNARVTLKNSPGGSPVVGALRCVSDDPAKLEVAGDCTTLKGLRLGEHGVTVSGGGASAKALVKVIPPPQPLGAGFTVVPALNIVAAPDGRPLIWGNRDNAPLVSTGSPASTVARPEAFRTRDGRVVGGMVATGRSSLGFVALSEDGEVYTSGNPRILGRMPIVTGSPLLIPSDPYFGKVTMSDNGPSLKHVTSIAIGHDNVMALTDEGQVYFWGGFSGAAFGVGEPGDRALRLMALPDKAVAVAAGSNWCLVLLANGRVMSILSSGEGLEKQAGRPAAVTSFAPGFVVDRTGAPLENITSIAAGGYNGFAVNAQGQVWGWGKTTFDQLGQGTVTSPATGALLVRSPDGQGYLSGITTVAASGEHALALHRNSQVYAWGYNDRGQLGDGNRRTFRYGGSYGAFPDLVLNEAGTGPLTGVRVIDTGMSHSLALGADGNLRAWGNGASFGLGQGAPLTYSYLPLLVTNEAGTAPLSFNPMSRWPSPTGQ